MENIGQAQCMERSCNVMHAEEGCAIENANLREERALPDCAALVTIEPLCDVQRGDWACPYP